MEKDLEALKEALPDFTQVQQRFTALRGQATPETLAALKATIEKHAQAPLY